MAVGRVPPELHHNMGKLNALRKAFAFTAHEGVEGDYLEFGVFQGTSLIAAVKACRGQQMTALGSQKPQSPCRFFGFDCFEGLPLDAERDAYHPIYSQANFAIPFERVKRRLRRFQRRNEISLVHGLFRETLQ